MQISKETKAKAHAINVKVCEVLGIPYIYAKKMLEQNPYLLQKIQEENVQLSLEEREWCKQQYKEQLKLLDRKFATFTDVIGVPAWLLRQQALLDDKLLSALDTINVDKLENFMSTATSEEKLGYVMQVFNMNEKALKQYSEEMLDEMRR